MTVTKKTPAKKAPAKAKAAETEERSIYDQLVLDIKAKQRESQKADFDVTTKEGEEAARKLVYSMSKLNGRAERWKKAEKAEIVAKGKKVDAIFNSLKKGVADAADPWKLKIEQQEKIRAEAEAAMQAMIDDLKKLCAAEDANSVEELESALSILTGMNMVEDAWGEFYDEAQHILRIGKSDLEERLEAAKEQFAKDQELEELRKKNAEFERREEERKAKEIAEAEAKARKEREEQEAEAKRIADEEAEQQRIADEAKAEEERIAREEQIRKDAEAKAIADREAEEKAAREEEERRAADEKHRDNVHNAIYEDLSDAGISKEDAVVIVEAIAAGKISNLSITY